MHPSIFLQEEEPYDWLKLVVDGEPIFFDSFLL
jgi:hypothetical protein